MKWPVLNMHPRWVILFFAVIYAAISFVNHYLFRTAALDLGLYTHTLYDYAHFRLNQSLLIEPLFRFRNQLGDHFDLFLMLISPLYWVFGTWTLIIVQWVAVLFGGYGIYQLIKADYPDLALPALIHTYLMWGIFSALAFDYHSNVVGAMFVPWTLLAVRRKQLLMACVFTLLTIMCKENLALWMGFIWLGLAWMYRTTAGFKWKAVGIALFSFAWFLVVLKYIMPTLAPSGENYIHFFFTSLGNDPQQAIAFIFTHPIDTLKICFTDPTGAEISRWIKPELFLFLLLSGGFVLFLRPVYLFMLLPVLAQKLLHDDFVKWGIYSHYSIEFTAIIPAALFTWLGGLKNNTMRIGWTLVVINGMLTLASFGPRASKWSDRKLADPFYPAHYQQQIDVFRVHQMLMSIPETYAVCASTRLVPHLANRRYIYCFPFTNAAIDLIILFKDPDTVYPCTSQEAYDDALHRLASDPAFELACESNGILLFRKKGLRFSF